MTNLVVEHVTEKLLSIYCFLNVVVQNEKFLPVVHLFVVSPYKERDLLKSVSPE